LAPIKAVSDDEKKAERLTKIMTTINSINVVRSINSMLTPDVNWFEGVKNFSTKYIAD
jgi:5-bromo-4-chloroindolyl phosphate hydrolysis protein